MSYATKAPVYSDLAPGDPWTIIKRGEPMQQIKHDDEGRIIETRQIVQGDIVTKAFQTGEPGWQFRIVDIFRFSGVYDGPGRPPADITAYATVYVGRAG